MASVRRKNVMTPKAGPTLNNSKRRFACGGKMKKGNKYACGGKMKK